MNRIKELRDARNMTQPDLASRINASRQSIGKWERGDVDLNTDTIAKLCEVFSCSADYLLGLPERSGPDLPLEDATLIAAYHTAPKEIQDIVDQALDRYRQKKETAAG